MDNLLQGFKYVKKDWGWELWLHNDKDADLCYKILMVAKGYMSSYHYHPKKSETFTVLHGKMLLEYGVLDDNGCVASPMIYELEPGESAYIYSLRPHRFRSMNNEDCIFLEKSSYHDNGDVVRICKGGKCDGN